jgi:CheY-like chemotaxis protein
MEEKSAMKNSILLIEDSEEDYQTILWTLKKIGAPYQLFRVSDGDEALDFLHHKGRYSSIPGNPLPSIIVLDLNLPGTDGRDILNELKNTEKFIPIPIIILTTSSSPKDVETCYRNRANSYILKPVNLDKFQKTIKLLLDYWFEVSLL